MSYIVDAEIPPEEFILDSILQEIDGVVIEAIPTISTDNRPIPYLKIENTDSIRLKQLFKKSIDNVEQQLQD